MGTPPGVGLRKAAFGLVLFVALMAGAPPAQAAIVQIQVGTYVSANNGTITPTLSTASTAGTLLVAAMLNGATSSANGVFTAPSGWVKAIGGFNSCCGEADVWYYVNNPGGITSATFTANSGGNGIVGQLSEWNGVLASSPVDKTGTKNQASNVAVTVATSATLTVANQLGIADFTTSLTNLTSYTAGTGWTHLFSDPNPGGYGADYKLGLASGATASDTETANTATQWEAAIATFKPSLCNTGGALTLTAPASASFPGVTLNGTNQTATATVVLTEDDERGTSTAGWNITGTSTTFTTGSRSLSTTATTVTAASKPVTGGNCVVPTNSIGYPITLPAAASAPTAVKLFNAAANTGQGPTKVSLTFQLAVPANAYNGSYSSTWTFSSVSGP